MTGDKRTIPLTLADLNVYEHIDGHPFGVVFNESFPFEHGLDDACFDLWGFGETEEEAVHQLLADTKQWNALYYGQNMKFELKRTEEAP